MDTTDVNFRGVSGLKQLWKHAIPSGDLVGCGNLKVALCFKNLLKDIVDVLSADVTFLALWKLFHNCHLP